ncbi:TPA: hypothetical protein DE059_01830 [Candidatus Peribacteria bacterium]|nr:hypothetical protein [Candidatus Peribacteria bacterium]
MLRREIASFRGDEPDGRSQLITFFIGLLSTAMNLELEGTLASINTPTTMLTIRTTTSRRRSRIDTDRMDN